MNKTRGVIQLKSKEMNALDFQLELRAPIERFKNSQIQKEFLDYGGVKTDTYDSKGRLIRSSEFDEDLASRQYTENDLSYMCVNRYNRIEKSSCYYDQCDTIIDYSQNGRNRLSYLTKINDDISIHAVQGQSGDISVSVLDKDKTIVNVTLPVETVDDRVKYTVNKNDSKYEFREANLQLVEPITKTDKDNHTLTKYYNESDELIFKVCDASNVIFDGDDIKMYTHDLEGDVRVTRTDL